jgi:hypothetical protein
VSGARGRAGSTDSSSCISLIRFRVFGGADMKLDLLFLVIVTACVLVMVLELTFLLLR